ncbi:GTP cyclohydrolase FolE2 [Alkalimonas collagenimarina]|uniref:GTP cyclohydrolase FolE2 n=1 Tax=Alkalimonas collagenimarina TaxID=400390 RepID=A0ABT9GZQ2_9GAMM|nr:GTP cyclohydrolase FolE2 [Alkalimonas collagenimarina]MDP4536503.1 GTP cyclohydrolase FolE2 [Alkalimonas collagenimarina]
MLQATLPDITTETQPESTTALNGVGMHQIDLMLSLADDGENLRLPAKANIAINLPATSIRGIHMSRLYRLLNDFSEQQLCTPVNLQCLLQQLLHSHQDCQSDHISLSLSFERMRKRPALITTDLAGWRSYPVQLKASIQPGGFLLVMTAKVQYSSTCPCSAALSRQLLQQKFLADFSSSEQLSKGDVASWLQQHGSYATPHSQRSEASIEVQLAADSDHFPISHLIDLAEQTLATPVQTAVKRADEQAFAKLNGQNLMFVEDAVRRLHTKLQQEFPAFAIDVAHLESLHPHDAIARVRYPEQESL